MPEWLLVDAELWEEPKRWAAIEAFRSLDTPMGEEAARWLREDAVANDGSTRTYALFGDAGVEGYFALAAGEVLLERRDARELGYANRSVSRRSCSLGGGASAAMDSVVAGVRSQTDGGRGRP